MPDVVFHFQVRSISICPPSAPLTLLRAYMRDVENGDEVFAEEARYPVVEVYPVIALQVAVGTLYSYSMEDGRDSVPGPFPDHRSLIGGGWEVEEACQRELKYLVLDESRGEVCELPPLMDREIQEVVGSTRNLETCIERLKRDAREYDR